MTAALPLAVHLCARLDTQPNTAWRGGAPCRRRCIHRLRGPADLPLPIARRNYFSGRAAQMQIAPSIGVESQWSTVGERWGRRHIHQRGWGSARGAPLRAFHLPAAALWTCVKREHGEVFGVLVLSLDTVIYVGSRSRCFRLHVDRSSRCDGAISSLGPGCVHTGRVALSL